MTHPAAQLLAAARAVHPMAGVHLGGVPDRTDLVVCTVDVQGVVLAQSAALPLDDALAHCAHRLRSISRRILAAAPAAIGDTPWPDEAPTRPES